MFAYIFVYAGLRRMKNQVVLASSCIAVQGVKRTALYDVNRQCSVRLPRHVAEAVLDGPREPTDAHLLALKDRLVALGYLAYVTSQQECGGFSLGHTRALQSPTTILSVDADFILNSDAGDFVRHLAEIGHSRHLMVHMRAEIGRNRIRRALKRAGVSYELVCVDEKDLVRPIFDSQHRQIGKRTLVKSARLSQRFRFDYQSLLRNKHRYEGYGLVHIRTDGTVWPNADEKHFSYGSYLELAHGRLLTNPIFRSVSTASKDTREICQECEFRLACNWSISARTRREALTSGPDHCGYDPYSEDRQDERL